jgi:hypothetical protein
VYAENARAAARLSKGRMPLTRPKPRRSGVSQHGMAVTSGFRSACARSSENHSQGVIEIVKKSGTTCKRTTTLAYL